MQVAIQAKSAVGRDSNFSENRLIFTGMQGVSIFLTIRPLYL